MTRAELELTPARPYSLERTIARITLRPEIVDRIDRGRYRRLLFVAGTPLLVSVEQEGPPSRATLRLRLEGEAARSAEGQDAARELVLEALGAATDLRGFYRAFRADPLLAPAFRASSGLCILGRPTVFEALVTAVLSQQVNLAFAYSIRAELARRFGRRARLDGASYVAFPTPERAFASGELVDAELRARDDEQVIDRLTALKGIGRWTAETVLMRGLARVDAFPAGDLAVVKHLAQELGHRTPRTEAEMRRFAERWRPYRALALTYAFAPSTSRAR